MMSRILFIVIAIMALMINQNLLMAPGTSINEPLIACALVLILSPWLVRQFE